MCAATLVGILVRPWRIGEWIWALGGALALVTFGLLPAGVALRAVAGGSDVYLFLAGMMLLAETARSQGVFDWLAAHAVALARGSSWRLYTIVFGLGAIVTAVLSNDATAVVLTPAVAAVTRKARVDPLPHLFACAMVANAASFVLPIANPANLVIFSGDLPPLGAWLRAFALPSVASIVVTFATLAFAERSRLRGAAAPGSDCSALTRGGRTALAGIGVAAAGLIAASAFGTPLGLPTAVLGASVLAAVSVSDRTAPRTAAEGVSWTVLLLVAGLFVLVAAVDRSGMLTMVRSAAEHLALASPLVSGLTAAFAITAASNLANNLPVAVLAGQATSSLHHAGTFVNAVTIGIDLGPNLSVTGSLATVLWLVALRREGIAIGSLHFLRVGAFVTPPALAAAIVALVASAPR